MPTLQGHFKIPHLDGKGEAGNLFREAGVPTTFLLTSFYWDDFIGSGLGSKRDADGARTGRTGALQRRPTRCRR